jgi:transcriptional regulator GlxA family with amidase domain
MRKVTFHVPLRADAPTHFVFLPIPNFTMLAFTNSVEVLRMANYLSGQPLFRWSIATPDGGEVTASNGLSIDTLRAERVDSPDFAFVCGGVDVQKHTTQAHLSALRQFAKSGCMLGSLCTGAYALARAGLLDGYSCAIHWENMSALKEAFPGTLFVKELFVIDRDRVTCTGGVAPLDMMLNLLSDHIGAACVARISEQFAVEHVRDKTAQQQIPHVTGLGSASRSIIDVIAYMEANIEEPLARQELARFACLSQRQLQRIFRDRLGVTPTQYYLNLRLRRARQLLLQTNMAMMDITIACGFRSACHFSKSYREAFGTTPTRQRRNRVNNLTSMN